VHTEDAEFAEFLRQLARRQFAGLEPRPDVRLDAVTHELADDRADRALVVAQKLVDIDQLR
jgi:hypothetical protein